MLPLHEVCEASAIVKSVLADGGDPSIDKFLAALELEPIRDLFEAIKTIQGEFYQGVQKHFMDIYNKLSRDEKFKSEFLFFCCAKS